MLLSEYSVRSVPPAVCAHMSVHADREEHQLLSRLQHVLNIGVLHTRNTNISTSRTRPIMYPRTLDDFQEVKDVQMGRSDLTLSRRTEASLRNAMASAQPLVVRSSLVDRDIMALTDEWELFVAQDTNRYQMGDGRGRQTLTTMWDSPMRLEHDLQDTTTQNPVMAWLSTAPRGSVAARFWQLQQQLEELAASHRPILRRPAFATGLVPTDGGGITHYDEYNNTAFVLAGMKTFFIAPPDSMSWENGPRTGNRNERLDVHPFVLGRHQEPSLKQWRVAMLGCGDVLYLPSGWWHHVLSTSHSVMTNVWTG